MTDITPELNAPPAFIDNPHAPEVLAEAASGFFLLNGNIHITLTSLRADHSKSPISLNRVVIGRLALPIAGAQMLAVELYDFLKQHDLDPAPPPADPHQIQ